MTVKTAAKNVGNGLLNGLTAIHNAQIQSQIDDIDKQADALRKQLTRLEEQRTELKSKMA